MVDQCVMVSTKRSPVGKYLGALSELEPLDLAVQVAKAALTPAGKSIGKEIDQIFVGNCIPSAFETGSVVGRQIGLKLGLDVFTTTIDTACCSPLTALRLAVWGLRLGELEAALIIGVESMSRVPHFTKELRTGVQLREVRLTYELRRRGGGQWMAAICGGLTQGEKRNRPLLYRHYRCPKTGNDRC